MEDVKNEKTSPSSITPTADPKKSLRDILGTKRRTTTSGEGIDTGPDKKQPSSKGINDLIRGGSAGGFQDPTQNTRATVAETIHTIVRLLAETKKVANAAIKERLAALDRGESSNKDFHKSIQTISALCLPDEGTPSPETWEAAARTEILYSLRDQIVGRVMLRNRRAFENSGPEEGARMVNALGQFRRISRGTEVKYASRENMAPGSSRTDARLLMDSPKKAKTAALEEILYCLAQITLGTIKDTNPKINPEVNAELQRYAVLLQNPRSAKPDLGPVLAPQKIALTEGDSSTQALVSQIETLLQSLCTEEKDKEKLQREIAVFDSIQESIGSNIETLDALAQEEFASVKSLEQMYEQLSSVQEPKTYKKPETPEELQLAIFQGIREIAPSMGKTTTMVMTSQLAQDQEWVEKFLESGTDAIYNAPSYKNLIILTEPENTLFGQPGDPEKYMEEGVTLRDALNLIYRAESSMYTRSVHESLAQKDREEVLNSANKVLHEELSQEEINANPILAELALIQSNAEKMANAVSREVEGSEKSLEVLPTALKEKERQDKVAQALNKSMTLITKEEVSLALGKILQAEEETLSSLLENPEQTENDKAAIVHTKEKIATLEALRDFSTNPYDLENKEYENMISTIALTRVPRTLREHALISLCDNKAADGTRLKTKDMLMRLETESGVTNLTNMLRSSLGSLRHYKERESAPVTIKRRELATSICRAPENLKKSMKEEMRNALKSCLIPPPWKSPFNTTSADLGNCNTTYLLAKKEYGAESSIFKAIRNLHGKTSDIQKESGNSLWVRADKIALDLRSKEDGSLKDLERKVLNLCLDQPSPKEALDYMASWYNSIGYEATLQEQTLQLPEEGYYHFEPIPMVAAKIQTKIENLFEISKYLKAVSRSPEALAETYIQHRLHEKKTTSIEAWEERLDRAEKRADAEISQELKELKDWKEKFNSIFDDQDEDDLTPEERDKNKSMRAVCHRKILQKERATESLILKKERLKNLKYTSFSLKGVKNAEEIGKALSQEDKIDFGFSMQNALDKALKLASSPSKIILPPKVDKTATPLQMLEAGAIEQTIKNIKSTLKEAQEILKVRSPGVANLDIENSSPEKSVEELKRSTFKVLKEIEMHLWESGQSIKLSKEEEEEFLQSNPDMVNARKDWVDTLKKTDSALQSTYEYAKSQPQIVRKKPKDKKEKEQSLEDFEQDMVAA